MDRDREAIEVAKERVLETLGPHGARQMTFHHGNFRDLPMILRHLQMPRLDGVLLDLGLSSLQVERAERGFSFLREGPLDMRMDRQQPMSAATLVNRLSGDELAHLIERFGEERFAPRIARRIVEARRQRPITTTVQLAQIVASAMPGGLRRGRLHPATRTFQALRIAVNDELGALEAFLAALQGLLAPEGRAVLLSFHSLEDRMVKQAFVKGAQAGLWTILTKKAVRPSDEERARNPRARSARLRAVKMR
jgi:16S rRNA (cytosine1402-N4)-methyltransferase